MIRSGIIALLSGLIFGAGLVISGMTNPEKVIGFLNIFGVWDYDLAFVLAAAVAITVIGFKIILKRKTPILEANFSLPTNHAIDNPLIIGTSLFGIGWGLFGYCPGPALVAMLYGNMATFLFIASMLFGMFLEHATKSVLGKRH